MWPALNGLQSPAEEHLCSSVPSKLHRLFWDPDFFGPTSPASKFGAGILGKEPGRNI